MTHKEIPVGIKVISILNFIVGAVQAVLGVLVLALGSFGLSIFYSAAPSSTYLESLSYVVVLVGVGLLLFSALYIGVGIGLWRGKAWARITQMILLILGFIGSVYSLIVGKFIILNLLNLLIVSIIFWYVCCSKEVRSVFE